LKDSRVHFHWQENTCTRNFAQVFPSTATRSIRANRWISSGALRKTRHGSQVQSASSGRNTARSKAAKSTSNARVDPAAFSQHAWKLEKSQIENGLDRESLVSLTDHDNIDAALHLSMLDETRDCPVSVEWTVPYRETFFHLGLHNLPLQEATSIMRDLAAFTANPGESQIARCSNSCTP